MHPIVATKSMLVLAAAKQSAENFTPSEAAAQLSGVHLLQRLYAYRDKAKSAAATEGVS